MPGQIEGAVVIPDFESQSEDYDGPTFNDAEREFEKALRTFISSGATSSSLESSIECILEDMVR